MHNLQLRNHLKTSNNYVRLQIFRDNVAMIENYKKTRDYKNLFYPLKQNIESALNRQLFLKKELEKKIAKDEQLNFTFGSPFLPNSN